MNESTSESCDRRVITRRNALVGGGAALIAASVAACGIPAAPAVPKPSQTESSNQGGNLRVGVAGGTKDLIDAQKVLTKADQARQMAGFETLINLDRNAQISYDGLAESVERTAPDRYVIKLRSGIEFHNGKSLSADDVIFSIQRQVDPKLDLKGPASIDPNELKKLDQLTVQMGLRYPDSTMPQALARFTFGIVPDGYTSAGASMADGQVGTGPFVLQSFSPGSQSVHTRFPNYWKNGLPHLERVTVIDINNETARANALIVGQVDAIADVPFALVSVVQAKPELVLFENPGGAFLPFNMAIDQEPFTDPRVRQAFRLIVDRQQMVQQAIARHGRVANDMYGAFEQAYPSELPQRVQDLPQAKSLLAAAGKSNLEIDLQTTAAASGMVEAAKVFATQAQAAGVTVNVKELDGTTFYGPQYTHWTFSNDYWGYYDYLSLVSRISLKTAAYNESHWPPATGDGSDFEALYQRAVAADDSTRNSIIKSMMTEEYNYGGLIIPFFVNVIDAYSSKLTGFQANRGHLNLDNYGQHYAEISFT